MAEKREGYRKLEVYEKSYRSAVEIYRMTADFPKEERYGITDQMRRASVSIALNVAEGYARRESQEELKRFL
jgi:four helix bundle protein